MHCHCLRAVKLKVMALLVINLWLSSSMFHGGYNGLGIVQIVGVTTKMTNDPPVTINNVIYNVIQMTKCAVMAVDALYLHNAA